MLNLGYFGKKRKREPEVQRTRLGYYPFSSLGHDREFSVVTKDVGSLSRQWILYRNKSWHKAGNSCRDQALHVATVSRTQKCLCSATDNPGWANGQVLSRLRKSLSR